MFFAFSSLIACGTAALASRPPAVEQPRRLPAVHYQRSPPPVPYRHSPVSAALARAMPSAVPQPRSPHHRHLWCLSRVVLHRCHSCARLLYHSLIAIAFDTAAFALSTISPGMAPAPAHHLQFDRARLSTDKLGLGLVYFIFRIPCVLIIIVKPDIVVYVVAKPRNHVTNLLMPGVYDERLCIWYFAATLRLTMYSVYKTF